MKSPEKADAMLEAVAPVDAEIADEDDFYGLEIEGLRTDGFAEAGGDDRAKPLAEVMEEPEDDGVPEEILAQEETEVGPPRGAEETLAWFGGEAVFEGAEDEEEEAEGEGGGEDCGEDGHGLGEL